MKRALALAAAALSSFLLLEALLVALEPKLAPGPFEYDPLLGVRWKPFYQGANRFGFNADDFPLEKPAGVYRVVVLGDSFGWAGGRDGNYTAVLQRRADAAFGRGRVQVIDAGYPMTSTPEELDLLRRDAIRYDPDLVVLGFYAGNDFSDADPARRRVVVWGAPVDLSPREPVLPFFGRALVPRSRAWLILSAWWRTRAARGPLGPKAAAMNGLFEEDAYVRNQADLMAFYSPLQRPAFRPQIQRVRASLAHMERYLRRRGVRLAVALLPAEFSVDDALAARALARLGPAGRGFERDFAQTLMKGWLARDGVPCLDLLPDFRREAARGRRLYLYRNSHWNLVGNELAGERLFAFLRAQVPELRALKARASGSPARAASSR